jgi:hypothetical protein
VPAGMSFAVAIQALVKLSFALAFISPVSKVATMQSISQMLR